jgi:hypothetical protein
MVAAVPLQTVALSALRTTAVGRGFTVSVAAVEFEEHPLDVVTTQL